MLRDLSFYATNKSPFRLNGDTWCIENLYLSCLSKYKSGNFKKVVVELIVKREDENKIQNMIDVISIRKRFDCEEYASVEKYEKKKILLDILHDGILTLAKIEEWPTEPLVDAYNCCIEKNIENKWLREDKYFLSPDRKHYAGIFCNWDIDKFEAFTIFLNKQKEEIKRVKLFEKEPWNVEPMGKMRWDKETGEFLLYSKDNKHKWATKLGIVSK